MLWIGPGVSAETRSVNAYRQKHAEHIETDPVDGSNSGCLFIAQTNRGGEGGVMLFAAHLPVCAGYK